MRFSGVVLAASSLAVSASAFVQPHLYRRVVAFRSTEAAAAASALAAKKTVFIDGEAGTTGIQVRDRISKRDDIEILSAPEGLRKDEATRKRLINEADAVILCKSKFSSSSSFSDELEPKSRCRCRVDRCGDSSFTDTSNRKCCLFFISFLLFFPLHTQAYPTRRRKKRPLGWKTIAPCSLMLRRPFA